MTENKQTISTHQFDFSKDLINPIMLLDFKNSEDKAFQFRSYNTEIICKFNKHDYYHFIDTLVTGLIDEYEEFEDDNTFIYTLEEFQDFLRTKFTEE